MSLRFQTMTAILALGASSLAFGQARVTVGHFAPFADTLEGTSVSVVINGETALEGVEFKDFTDYIELDEGHYTIDIVPTGAADPAITADFSLTDGQDYTVFATGNGSLQPLELMALADDNTAPDAGNVKLRVYHAAPFAAMLEDTEVSIRTASGDIVGGLQGVPFGVGSDYLEIPAGSYDLKVASNDGLVNYIDPLPVDLPAGAVVTVFAVGDGVNQPLGLIAVPVGELPLRTPVDESASGIFQLLDEDGEKVLRHGFNLFSLPRENRVVGNWLYYDEEGEPTFLTFDSGDGGFDGEMAVTTLYRTSGEGTPETVDIGTVTIGIAGCRSIMLEVEVGDEAPVMYQGARLTPTVACDHQ